MASHALELGLDHAGHISAAPAGSVLGSDQKEGHGETGQGVEAEGTCSSLCVPVPVIGPARPLQLCGGSRLNGLVVAEFSSRFFQIQPACTHSLRGN